MWLMATAAVPTHSICSFDFCQYTLLEMGGEKIPTNVCLFSARENDDGEGAAKCFMVRENIAHYGVVALIKSYFKRG